MVNIQRYYSKLEQHYRRALRRLFKGFSNIDFVVEGETTENMIDFVNSFKIKITPRDDIAGQLKLFRNLEKEKVTKSMDYFHITELILPTDSFMNKKFGKEKSQQLKNVMAQGSKIHSIAQNWLRQHKNYNGSEAILDGIFIGLPVRGRVDGRIKDTIVEIKSISNKH